MTSLTGNSSPVAERTEDEAQVYNSRNLPEPRRPLAERMLPKPRKTGVDELRRISLYYILSYWVDGFSLYSMLETPDYPTLSRVMRVQPLQDEKPASGFPLGGYEDMYAGENVGGGNEADGEDDGWGVVKSKSRSSKSSTYRLPQF